MMQSLSTPTFFSLVLLFSAASIHAEPSSQSISQIHDRASYVGGWPLALAASESSGCPGYASVTVKNQYVALQCCPSGQTGFLDENSLSQYCCPDRNNCFDDVKLFPACANSTWIMYQYGQEVDYFCCEPGQIATQGDGNGLCEPAGVAVPSDMIRPTVSQDTVAAAAATSSSAAAAGTTAMTSASSAVVVVSTDTKVAASSTTSTVGGKVGNSTSAIGGGDSTPAVPSRGANTTATTLTSVAAGNPVSVSATVSATGTASGTASPSAKTGGCGSIRAASGFMGAVAVALCLGVVVVVLLG